MNRRVAELNSRPHPVDPEELARARRRAEDLQRENGALVRGGDRIVPLLVQHHTTYMYKIYLTL